jgi:DNA (cytosine-5)-methyltransferase 1
MTEGTVFRLGELFCGPGGLALGAKGAIIQKDGRAFSIRSVWANDIDRDACDTYAKNISPGGKTKVICKDVHKLDMDDLGPIDALSFGFPCNDFSIVGEQKGINGVYGPLYSYGVKALKKFKPKWFLAENVGGLRNANEGRDFAHVLECLFDAGYDIYPNLYEFEYYGVPQARHRIIIIGIRRDQKRAYEIPAHTTPIPITSRKAIEDPPIPDDAANNELTAQNKRVAERLAYIKPGQNAFNAEIPKALRLNVNGAKISQIYKRLDPDKPSYTITGSGGGGTHVYHWSENRALTNRERARLQTFPDDFVFCGSKESIRKQIGMAVPPAGAKIIFEAVLKTFAGIKYESIAPSIESRIHEKNTLESFDMSNVEDEA